jgi:hypothetical protein
MQDAQTTETTNEKLEIYKSKLEEVLVLGIEVIEEKSKHSKLVELNVEMSKMIQSLEDESKFLKSKVATAETTLRIFQVSEAHIKNLTTETLNENSQLQESFKQLLQEAEVWKEK